MAASHTIKIDADVAETEAKLERLCALAERFKELWGDAPLPDGIERFVLAPGDRLVLRYDDPLSEDVIAEVKARAAGVFRLPAEDMVLLTNGLRLEGVLAPE
jgi:hypothetical protein